VEESKCIFLLNTITTFILSVLLYSLPFSGKKRCKNESLVIFQWHGPRSKPRSLLNFVVFQLTNKCLILFLIVTYILNCRYTIVRYGMLSAVLTNWSLRFPFYLLCFSFPGFSRIRLHTKGGSPVAFVEYADVRCATQAMAALQGSYLRYSDRGGIRIEYAKTKMGEGNGLPNNGTLLSSGANSVTMNGHHHPYNHVNHVNTHQNYCPLPSMTSAAANTTNAQFHQRFLINAA